MPGLANRVVDGKEALRIACSTPTELDATMARQTSTVEKIGLVERDVSFKPPLMFCAAAFRWFPCDDKKSAGRRPEPFHGGHPDGEKDGWWQVRDAFRQQEQRC
jgi:hypothetical protein